MADPRIEIPAAVVLPNQNTATLGQIAPAAEASLTPKDINTLWRDVYTLVHTPLKSEDGTQIVPRYTLWDYGHAHLVDSQFKARAQNREYIVSNNRPGIPMMTGSFKGNERYRSNHGGGYIADMLQKNGGNWSSTFRYHLANAYTDKVSPTVRSMTIRQAFNAERRMMESPVAGKFPDMNCEMDAFRHLETWLDFVPQVEWGKSWKNFRGKLLTFNMIMTAATESYVNPKTEINGAWHHGDLHLPQLLLKYHTMRGNKQMSQQIQHAFLKRELSGEIKDIWDVNGVRGSVVFHYVETLGVMLDHPDLTWSAEDMVCVRAWLIQLREFISTNEGYWGLFSEEAAHYHHGMELIAKNSAKIFPNP